MKSVLHNVIAVLGIGAFAWIAYCDVRTRRIPNEFAVAVAVLGLARATLAGDALAALHTVAAAAVVFAVSFVLFWRGWIGGGDAKLLPGAALLVGYHDLFGFLVVMSVCGGLLALAAVGAGRFGVAMQYLLYRAVRAPREPATMRARPSVPYGVAIAAAGILILVLQSSQPG